MKTACPDEEMLADYIEGRLSDYERYETEKHIALSGICLEEFIVAHNIIRHWEQFDHDTVPSEVTHAAVRLIKSRSSLSYTTILRETVKRSIKGLQRKVSGLFPLTLWGAWDLSSIRGSEKVIFKDLIHLKKTFKEIDAEIEIEKTGENKTLIRIKLLKDPIQGKRIRVTLKKGEREISSHLLIEEYVLLEDIPFGHYNLTFIRDREKLGTYSFNIKESSYEGK
ncbi:MAG: hypothetical protein U9R17_11425 [Thermodesulfobacteriota bacterium]|nr:hypothetical protein [Thermodesulfobacteriota bacterium]